MGYAIFDRKESDEIGAQLADAQKATPDFSRFAKIVALRGFTPFGSAEDALENINDVSEGVLSPVLRSAIESNVPPTKDGKKAKAALGVGEEKIGKSIQEEMGTPVVCNDLTRELLRGCRAHLSTFLKGLRSGDVERAQLGLAHSYSRCKVRAALAAVLRRWSGSGVGAIAAPARTLRGARGSHRAAIPPPAPREAGRLGVCAPPATVRPWSEGCGGPRHCFSGHFGGGWTWCLLAMGPTHRVYCCSGTPTPPCCLCGGGAGQV